MSETKSEPQPLTHTTTECKFTTTYQLTTALGFCDVDKSWPSVFITRSYSLQIFSVFELEYMDSKRYVSACAWVCFKWIWSTSLSTPVSTCMDAVASACCLCIRAFTSIIRPLEPALDPDIRRRLRGAPTSSIVHDTIVHLNNDKALDMFECFEGKIIKYFQ